MRTGTPGFVGERLTTAREIRGMTQVELARLLEVHKQSISQYEAGSNTPSPETLDRMSIVLGMPRSFFTKPLAKIADTPVFFRSNDTATRRARTIAERRLGCLQEIGAYLSRWVEFPATDFPTVDLPKDVIEIPDSKIAELASRVRSHWGLGEGPIADVLGAMESHGIVVARDTFQDADGLDALSRWCSINNRPVVLLNTDKASAVRSRFDAAHELGHVLLHHDVVRRHMQTKEEFKLLERQAHYFASSFLLPERSFANDVYSPTLDGFRLLKERWHVSIGMMVFRAHTIGMISDTQRTQMYVAMARRGWKTREPMDDELVAEQPTLVRGAVELLVNQGVCSRGQIASDLAMNRSDAEALSGLAPGFLNESLAPVLHLKARARDDNAPAPFAPAGVLQFPNPRD